MTCQGDKDEAQVETVDNSHNLSNNINKTIATALIGLAQYQALFSVLCMYQLLQTSQPPLQWVSFLSTLTAEGTEAHGEGAEEMSALINC